MGTNDKMIGYVLYAVGIIGGAEGALGVRQQYSLMISIVALIVIIIGSYLLGKR